jgi:RNA polymerase sigma factor (sigma-70 family)
MTGAPSGSGTAMTSGLHVSKRLPFDSSDSVVREAGWDAFISAHTKLLLHVARSLGGDHDEVMDRFTYLLEQLRRDDFRRLRGYVATEQSEFSTWLVVVAQRIYLDHHRARYGRVRSSDRDSATNVEERAARRRLINLIGAEIDLDAMVDGDDKTAEDSFRVEESHRALMSALAMLAPVDRLLIKLRFEDGLGMPEIARNLGLRSRFHAYRQLTQALADLRKALERVGVREAEP